MPRIDQRLPSPDGLAAGQTATIRLAIGRKYHHITIEYSGIKLSEMTELRVHANSKVIQRFLPEDLNSINIFDGRDSAYLDPNATTGILMLPFDRFNLKTTDGEEATALNTGSLNANNHGIKTLHLEIELAPTLSNPSLTPKIESFASQSDKVDGGAGMVRHIQKISYQPSGEGIYEISDLPRGGPTTQYLNRIIFKTQNNSIEKLELERNNHKIFERTRTLNERIQREHVRFPQDGFFIMDRTEMGRGADALSLLDIDDLRFKLHMTQGEHVTAYVEYLGAIGD